MTGVVAIACARHGCFLPGGLVDLFKGEQQKNVDWAFIKALATSKLDPAQRVLLIYGIFCQYSIHFYDRIGHLLPTNLEVDGGIGSFHVHSHKEQCFFRYCTSFIPNSGVTVGEILEPLWANMNQITPAARTASLANRAELLDDHAELLDDHAELLDNHASDSNHKKALGLSQCRVIAIHAGLTNINFIGLALADRYLQSKDMLALAESYWNGLSASVAYETRLRWEEDILDAEARRRFNPAVMDILSARQFSRTEGISGTFDISARSKEAAISMTLLIEEKQ